MNLLSVKGHGTDEWAGEDTELWAITVGKHSDFVCGAYHRVLHSN